MARPHGGSRPAAPDEAPLEPRHPRAARRRIQGQFYRVSVVLWVSRHFSSHVVGSSSSPPSPLPFQSSFLSFFTSFSFLRISTIFNDSCDDDEMMLDGVLLGLTGFDWVSLFFFVGLQRALLTKVGSVNPVFTWFSLFLVRPPAFRFLLALVACWTRFDLVFSFSLSFSF